MKWNTSGGELSRIMLALKAVLADKRRYGNVDFWWNWCRNQRGLTAQKVLWKDGGTGEAPSGYLYYASGADCVYGWQPLCNRKESGKKPGYIYVYTEIVREKAWKSWRAFWAVQRLLRLCWKARGRWKEPGGSDEKRATRRQI